MKYVIGLLVFSLTVSACGKTPTLNENVSGNVTTTSTGATETSTISTNIPGSDPNLGTVTGPFTGTLHPTKNTANIVDSTTGQTIYLRCDNSSLPDGTTVSYYVQAKLAIDVAEVIK